MWFLHLHNVLQHFAHLGTDWGPVTITCGAALLIGCAASCILSPSPEKDDLFHKHVF